MKRYGVFLNAVLVILGTLAGLVLAEIALNLSGKIVLGWQNSSYRAISNKSYIPIDPNKKFKILCLGDSSTYGSGVKIQYSYPYQLSELLNKQSSQFEVSVISTGGTNSSEFANRYEKFLKTDQYDLVIFQAGINDVHRLQECNIPLYTQHPFWAWLAGSRLFNLVKTYLIDREGFSNEIDKKYGLGSFLFLDSSSLHDLYRRNLNKIADVSRKNGVILWVQDYHTPGWHRPENVLYKVYKEQDLEVIHQKEIFDYAHGIRMRGHDGWHPNCYGYFVIARLVYNNMVDHGMIRSEKYDLHTEIDHIRAYIRDKGQGYQFLEDSNRPFDENKFIRAMRNIVPDLDDPKQKAGNFRINGIFDFDNA